MASRELRKRFRKNLLQAAEVPANGRQRLLRLEADLDARPIQLMADECEGLLEGAVHAYLVEFLGRGAVRS